MLENTLPTWMAYLCPPKRLLLLRRDKELLSVNRLNAISQALFAQNFLTRLHCVEICSWTASKLLLAENDSAGTIAMTTSDPPTSQCFLMRSASRQSFGSPVGDQHRIVALSRAARPSSLSKVRSSPKPRNIPAVPPRCLAVPTPLRVGLLTRVGSFAPDLPVDLIAVLAAQSCERTGKKAFHHQGRER